MFQLHYSKDQEVCRDAVLEEKNLRQQEKVICTEVSGELNLNNKVSNLEEDLHPLKQMHLNKKKIQPPYIKTLTVLSSFSTTGIQAAIRNLAYV